MIRKHVHDVMWTIKIHSFRKKILNSDLKMERLFVWVFLLHFENVNSIACCAWTHYIWPWMLHPVKGWACRAQSLKVPPSFKKKLGPNGELRFYWIFLIKKSKILCHLYSSLAIVRISTSHIRIVFAFVLISQNPITVNQEIKYIH